MPRKKHVAVVRDLNWPYKRHYETFASIRDFAEKHADFHCASDPRVARTLSFMARNSSDILSVPDIARHVGVGRQTLERGFHEQLGRTVNDSTSSGGAGSVPGTDAFTAPATQPDAGTATGGVTFTPDDALNYQPASTSVNVTVNPAMTAFDTWAAGRNLLLHSVEAATSGGALTLVGVGCVRRSSSPT